MRVFSPVHAALLLLPAFLLPAPTQAREWTDSTGLYSVQADLIAFNQKTVVLKKDNHDLIGVPIDRLSAKDQAFLKSEEATTQLSQTAGQPQVWTMKSGLKVPGKVVDYGRREVTLQRRRGKIYVNDRQFENLNQVQQAMIPRIVGHFEKKEITDKKGLEDWIARQRGEPRTFTCEGVVLELPNGDEYGVPFFFFSTADLNVLEPGWQRWLAANNDRQQKEQQAFLLQSQSQAYQQDREARQQVAMLQLELQGYQAGLFDLWEVRLFPGSAAGMPMQVVVPARNSGQAAQEALRRYPGYQVGPVSKVLRKY